MNKVLLQCAAQIGRDENGSSIIELAFIVPFLLYILCGAVDMGRAYYLQIELSSATEAGTIYALNNPTDTNGITAATKLNAPDVSNVTTSVVYGCECSDGTGTVPACGSAPTCTDNYVSYVDVTTSFPYTTILKYPGIPTPVSLTRTARLRVGGN